MPVNIALPNLISKTWFPDLSDIVNQEGLPYPEIAITELQRVAVENCRLPPSEVSTELLLDASMEDNSSSHNQLAVINGSSSP